MKVLNHDIASLIRRLRRFKFELVKSVSSGVSEFGDHDLKRMNAYLAALKHFKGWMVSQPILDLPETSPLEIELGEMPEIPLMENEDVALIVNLFKLIEMEVGYSQSARRSTGMIEHDAIRFDTYILKIEKFLADFIANTNPLDLPESAPSIPVTGEGRTGI